MPIDAIFGSTGPLEIDVGCGKGRFLLARASARPRTNFIGIDRLLKRTRTTDRKISRAGLKNVRLLRIEAAYAVEHLLPPSSVSAFYFFFPDPWPKRRHHRRRLFSPEFMDSLHRTLTPEGQVHIATDYAEYLEGIRKLFAADRRFKGIPPLELSDEERTEFELLFMQENVPVGRASYAKLPA